MPSVTFAPSVDERPPSQKRRRDRDLKSGATYLRSGGDDDGADDDPPQDQKRYRPNEEDLDDTVHWQSEKEGIGGYDVPSEKDLLEAKRKRREIRLALESDQETKIDDLTSLASEGIAIEPFHMKKEESDGTGFFCGDTYIFRKYNVEEGEDVEPDAWLDRLREDETEGKMSRYTVPFAKPESAEPAQECIDELTKEQLYQKVLTFLDEGETVAQALRRYGNLMKPTRGKIRSNESDHQCAHDEAKVHLSALTGAANALLLQGEVEIYQTTKLDILRILPSHLTQPARGECVVGEQQPAKWEYRGNQDGAIHGPYTTEQMMAWVKAGFFVGGQRVKVRSIREESKDLSTKDALLADLLDDDDEDPNSDSKPEVVIAKGEWQWSNEIDFCAYLPRTNA